MGSLCDFPFERKQHQGCRIFVAPGFNPGEMGIEENRPRNNMEQNVNLPSDEAALSFKQEILGGNACQVKLDSKIRKTKN
jgi:hypothetical protein